MKGFCNDKNFIYTEVDSVIFLEIGFHTALLALNLLPSEAGLELVILLPPSFPSAEITYFCHYAWPSTDMNLNVF